MTYEELGQRLIRLFPHYRDENARTLAIAFLRSYPQYLDLISPFARESFALMSEPIETDFHLFHPNVKAEEDKAQTMAFRAARVAAIHEVENLVEASSRGIPREILGQSILGAGQHQSQMELMKLQTDENIRLERERANIEIEKSWELAKVALTASREQVQHTHRVLESLKQQLFQKYEERSQLEQSTDPTKQEKLTLLNTSVKLLESDYYGRAKQTLISATDGTGLGSGTQNTEATGRPEDDSLPDS